MLKRILLVVAAVVILFALARPVPGSDQRAAPATQAPALSAVQAARLSRLKALPAPDPKFTLATGAKPVTKPTTVKKEISCGVFVYPPNPNPMATSNKLFWVNSTGAALPPGVLIEWEVEGAPSGCCKGVAGPTVSGWPPNPPTPMYFHAANPVLMPPQPWTRPCKAWVIIP